MMSIFVVLLTMMLSYISIEEMAGSELEIMTISILTVSVGASIVYCYILKYLKHKHAKKRKTILDDNQHDKE